LGGIIMENKMFCFQCQETAGCTGCTKFGVCGKSPDLARMQDLLIYTTKGLSEITTRLREEGKEVSKDVNHLITINLFTTITNANFDDEVFYQRVKETLATKEALLAKLDNKENLSESALYNATSKLELDEKSTKVGVLATENEDIRSLRELIIYGIKGMSAYMKHANALGYDSEDINAFMQETLAKTLDENLTIDELIALTLETGKVGVDGMALLDSANTGTYGHPEITKVNINKLFTKVDDQYGTVIENVDAKLFDAQIPKIYKWVKSRFELDKDDYDYMINDSDFIDMITDELVNMVDIDKVKYDKQEY
jgi:hydroxylamine reductase